jgi:hypothetical protein
MQQEGFSFTGELWCPQEFDASIAVPLDTLPDYEVFRTMRPQLPNPSYCLYLTSMIPDVTLSNVPAELDLRMIAVTLSVTSDGFLTFNGTICTSQDSGDDPEDGNSNAVVTTNTVATTGFSLASAELTASYNWKTHGGLSVKMYATAVIIAQDPIDNVNFSASINYDGDATTWQLSASLTSLRLATLFSFFPAADGTAIMNILGHISIEQLGMDYTYTDGVGTDFTIGGSLVLDVFDLKFTFIRHIMKDVNKDWSFTANFGAAPGVDTSLKNLLTAVIGDDSVTELLPSFVDFDIGANSQTSMSLVLETYETDGSAPKDEKGNQYMVSALSVMLASKDATSPSLSFTIIQLQEKNTDDAAQGTPLKDPKRMFRISLEGLPFASIPNIPLVGNITQPFEGLEYVWVHDPDAQGITREEIKGINTVLANAQLEQLLYQDNTKPTPGTPPPPRDVLLAAGSHFVVVKRDTTQPTSLVVALDYVFGRPEPPAPPAQQKATDIKLQKEKDDVLQEIVDRNAGDLTGVSLAAAQIAIAKENAKEDKGGLLIESKGTDPDPDPDAQDPSGDTSMVKFSKTIGPLTISNFGLRFTDGNTLHMIIDAEVRLGEIAFELLGFGIHFSFGPGASFSNLSAITPGVDLSGLAVSFDNPPLTITGMFAKQTTPNDVEYVGGIVLTYEPYSFMAVGAYGEETKPDGGTFKHVSIFAMLNGPLIELEIGEINGVSFGFGYNSVIRTPSVSDFSSFPLTANNLGPPGTDPLALMTKINQSGWTTPTEGPTWIAVGLQALFCEILTVEAAVILGFDPYLNLAIIGKCVAIEPAVEGDQAVPRDECMIWAELDVIASVSVRTGTSRIEAQLNPNSFVFNPSCHLAGAFALCYWFAGSGHDGDWVFSMGGYHPAWSVPSHYPNPARLSITWELNPCTTVVGEAYFAVTPKVCMGGGSLSVNFNMVRSPWSDLMCGTDGGCRTHCMHGSTLPRIS